MENNNWVLSDLPPGCKPLDCKWIFKRKIKVNGIIDKFKARLERIGYFDTYAPVVRITTIRLLLALAVIDNLMLYQMDVKITFLNGDLDEEVYMKQPEGLLMSDNEHKVYSYSDASWINHFEDSSSTSGWVFLLGGGAISWASKKQTYITGFTIESEFVALVTAGVRHSMVKELIRNGVISIESVRTQQNLADHLTKGLAWDLVNKGQGAAPFAESKGRAPCWGLAARSVSEGRGGLPLVEVKGKRPEPNDKSGTRKSVL
nr:zinc finger, CCHC-type [Tanacetum cinerariifolium]